MVMNNKYFNAATIYLIANGIGQGCTLLSNIYFTRFMSQIDYGLYSNYYSYVAIFASIIGVNLYVGLSNAYIDFKNDIYRFRSAVLTLALILFVFTFSISILMYDLLQIDCYIYILNHALGFFLINYYITSLNMENNYKIKGLMLCIPNLLQVILSIIAVTICNNYVYRIYGSASAIFICGIFSTLIIFYKYRPNINISYWKYALKISLPAVITSVSYMIMQQCDKIMITSILGAEQTAIYSLIFYIGYILLAVQQATGGVWQVWLYRTLENGNMSVVVSKQKIYIKFMIVISIILYMSSPDIIKLLSPEQYWHFEYVVPFIIGSYIMFLYNFHISALEFYKKTGVISIIVCIATIINIILNYYCINLYGGIAAAYTSIISYLIIFLCSGIYLKSRYGYFYDVKYIVSSLISVVIMGWYFLWIYDNEVQRYVSFLSGIGFMVIMYYKDYKKINRKGFGEKR